MFVPRARGELTCFYRFTRSLKRRLNHALHRLGVGPILLIAACSQCNLPPPVPQEPTSTSTSDTTSTSTTVGPTLEQQCADVCESYRERDCVEAENICAADGFDESGECARWLNCAQACTERPDYYLSGECEQ